MKLTNASIVHSFKPKYFTFFCLIVRKQANWRKKNRNHMSKLTVVTLVIFLPCHLKRPAENLPILSFRVEKKNRLLATQLLMRLIYN